MNDLTGKTLENRYEVTGRLGEGGMGKVYLAKDKRFGKQVVVKVPMMEAGDLDFKDRFMREIASLAKLEHAHIVLTMDWGELEGVPYLVLRYLGGGSLRNRITDENGFYKPMAMEGLAQWLPQMASALDFIHSKGWVHRDLKPDNILFDESGSPYLADFGIAKALEGNTMGVKTKIGAFLGTPQYMAPEMHLGKGIGPKADQFGLAVVVYEALAGKIPFEGATPTAIFVEILQGKARPIHEVVQGINLEKSEVLMRAMSKDPKARHGSCSEFARALLGGGREIPPGELPENGVKTPQPVTIPPTKLTTPGQPEIPPTIKGSARNKIGIDPIKLPTPQKQPVQPTRLNKGPRNPTKAKSNIPATKTPKEATTIQLGVFSFSSPVIVIGFLVILELVLFVWLLPFMLGNNESEEITNDKKGRAHFGQEQEAKFRPIEKTMVLIPAGKFMMGSPASEKGRCDNETQHEVTLAKPFYMGKYEVTQEQWEAVMGNNPGNSKEAKLPITNVSWNDCQDFIAKLNAKPTGGYRLPNEAEWEYACRAGTTTAYSFGERTTKNDANYEGSGLKVVGSYRPNAFGLYDMHENAWEWCEDWHADYPKKSVTDPKGPATGISRVLRGGSFYIGVSVVRSSLRNSLTPSYRDFRLGFRLARTAQ